LLSSEADVSGSLGKRLSKAVSVLSRIASVSTTCPTCEGDGAYVETRSKRLDELSSGQFQLLFEADAERNLADEDEMPDQNHSGGHTPQQPPAGGGMSQGHPPPQPRR
jgi:hypothetical protein